MPPCPLCQNETCDCNHKLAPFALYDKAGTCWGQFATIDICVSCARITESHTGLCQIHDRHGCPIRIPGLTIPAKPPVDACLMRE